MTGRPEAPQIDAVERLSLPGYQRPRLQAIARDLGIRGYSRMNRTTLIVEILMWAISDESDRLT